MVEWRGWGGLLQTDSIGNSGVAGVQPSIKCNLMLQGMFACYVSDSTFALHEFPVLINDLMAYPHFYDSRHASYMAKYVLRCCQCPLALPVGIRQLCTCHVRDRDTEKPFLLGLVVPPYTHLLGEPLAVT